MVTLGQLPLAMTILAQANQPVWLQLEPHERARVAAALAALIMLGCALVGFAWWAARFARKYMNRPTRTQERETLSRLRVDDWADKPLIPHDDE
jgi:hypothetical protein